MYVRDVIRATATASGICADDLLSLSKTRNISAARQLGLLVASRLTGASWPLIGRIWGGRDRATTQAAALKADARLAAKDGATLALLAKILAELQVETLPATRTPAAAYRYRPSTIRARILQTEARLASLRAQLSAMEARA
ncbi:hypothetical protein OVA11_14120 [Caulobacter sp. SL161]|uniref:helix-turn-helix domain-containing protein n=1 Tax=Caulobacter sp. SL161 TaxID=2995156 RepID=UPI002274EFA4|nr:helix-turn-helix domain-containing protein [Caulobacter sp. SL161]MCY1648156.1 hypothetical protein [Caulobacter sp. SL161]